MATWVLKGQDDEPEDMKVEAKVQQAFLETLSQMVQELKEKHEVQDDDE